MSKNRHYHIIRITYSDTHVNQRSFANKHVALRWMAYRQSISEGESVIYAGTMLHQSIPRLIRKNERMALERIRDFAKHSARWVKVQNDVRLRHA